MENNILTLEKILGNLKQVSFPSNRLKCSDFIDTSRFSATVYTISCWSDYGQYNEDRLILTHDGKTDDIEFNEYIFSSTVKDIHFFYTSREYHRHDFTLNVQTPKGEFIELTFRIFNDELLPHIVYAMILLTYIKDLNKTTIFWNMLNGNNSQDITLGQKLDFTNELSKKAQNIIQEYPFTKLFFQNGLKEIVSNLKSELSSFELLK